MVFKLPNWKRNDQGSWFCDDPKAMVLAQRAVLCQCGFNVPEFDLWLTSIEPGAARDEFMKRRARAGDATSHDAMLRDLEYLQVNWAYSVQLLPSVQRDDKRQEGTRKPRRPNVDDWIDGQLRANPAEKSPALWHRAPEWITDQIGQGRFAKRVTVARKRGRK